MKFLRFFFCFNLLLALILSSFFSLIPQEALVKAGNAYEQFNHFSVDEVFSVPEQEDQKGFSYKNLITDSKGNEPGGGNLVISAILNVIDILLLLIGTFAFIAVAYGGFILMQAGGDEGNIDKGKNILKQSISGLVIAFSSYIIVRFIESLFS